MLMTNPESKTFAVETKIRRSRFPSGKIPLLKILLLKINGGGVAPPFRI
jgi:hypothetical protein